MPAKTKKKSAKKPAARKPAAKKAKPPRPVGRVVPNHRFAPGTKVSFCPAHSVGVERAAGREPFAKPVKTAKVKRDGTLEVSGLPKGQWCAAGPVGETWRYFQFSVS